MSVLYTNQPQGQSFAFSYAELLADYERFCDLPDEEFLHQLPQAIHFACVVGWLKELSPITLVADEGIIHQLAHLLAIPEEPLVRLRQIRRQFEQVLKLSR
jgi:hypothetical protein